MIRLIIHLRLQRDFETKVEFGFIEQIIDNGLKGADYLS